MPINYKLYDKTWKTKIRPDILEREGYCCKVCKAKNGSAVFRGVADGIEIYQDIDANIYRTDNGEFITCNAYAIIDPSTGNPNQKAVRVVLTIAHLDHDTTNNEYTNLAALCQLHHLRHDKEHHMKNSRKTRDTKKGLQELF